MKQHNFFLLSVFFLLFLTGNNNVLSQTKDTLVIKPFLENPFYKDVLNVFEVNEHLFLLNPIQNYTEATLGASIDSKDIADAQTPSTEKEFFLKAKGIYSKNKTWLIGDLSIIKNYQKNLGYNLSNLLYSRDEVEKSPFFNLAYQKGDWNNQFYDINGTILHQFSPSFFASTTINYNVNQYFRTENPTPELIYLDALASVRLGYKINSKNTFGITGHAGFLNNEIQISYIGNASELNIPINEAIYSRISVGLGLIESAKTSISKEKENTTGAGLFYVYNFKKNSWNFNVDYLLKKNSFYEVYSSENNLLGTYEVSTINSNISKFSFDKKTVISLENSFKKGNNFRVTTNGKNYEATSVTSKIKYSKASEKIAYSFFAGFNFLKKNDYQALNYFSYKNVNIGGTYYKDFHFKKGKIYGNLIANLSSNIYKKEDYGTFSKYIEDVTQKRVQILTATRTDFSIKLGYNSKIKSKALLDYGTKFSLQNFIELSDFKGYNNALQLYLKIIY